MSRELVNLSQAAQRTGRPRKTIQSWVIREKLFHVGLEHDGTKLYDLADVRRLAASSKRRRSRGKGRSQRGQTSTREAL